MDLFETMQDNQPEYTVSELSGVVKRVIEGEFGLVRVRGEIGRISRPSSGHMYFDLKDDRSVIAAISWKGQVAKLAMRPEEGMEVIATGRMTTFPGQSKYQLIVEDMVPAGAGALMLMLEKRRLALAAEGLFDADRKQALPFLPQVIGVITSPSGAVIRDILHRLRDRFPRHVLIWPVAVQGHDCAAQVAAAIDGFNALPIGGAIARPDVIIVARGGGSIEDLWGFNEEIVVRAAARSVIPLISAVGHETDTTLLDYAADLRAPTPTAAAEMAVPVRLDLVAQVDGFSARLSRAVAQGQQNRLQRTRDLARALPRLESLLANPQQRFDSISARLSSGLAVMLSQKQGRFGRVSGGLSPYALRSALARQGDKLRHSGQALHLRLSYVQERQTARFAQLSARLQRAQSEIDRRCGAEAGRLLTLAARLDTAATLRLRDLMRRLDALDRTRQTMGYQQTLQRGYVVLRDLAAGGALVTTKAAASHAGMLEAEFYDGRFTLGARSIKVKPSDMPPEQGRLF